MQLADYFRRTLSWFSWRRAHKRRRADVPVDWRVFGAAVHRVSTTADVSPGGAFVRTAERMPLDTPVVLELAMPSGPVEMHARVAWTAPGGMGVRFMRHVA